MKQIINQTLALLMYLLSISMASAQPVVTYPNGGETLVAGTPVKITWTGTPLNTLVAIDYTVDKWANTVWISTNYQNPAENSFTWIVPNKPGNKCKVGVFNASTQGDISDNFFTISTSTGLTNPISLNTVDIYPNPTNDIMHIISLSGSLLSFRLMDMTGQEVQIAVVNEGNGNYCLHKGSLKCGIYNMIISDIQAGSLLRRRIIIE